MDTLIKVKVKKNFGRIDLLPANELAEKFCRLLHKPVLPEDAVIKLRDMGYTVQEVLEPTI